MPTKDNNSTIPKGCILLARVILDSAIWGDTADTLKLFIYILLEARHDRKPKCYPGVEVKRGELVTSYAQIAEANKWNEQKAERRWSRPKIGRMLGKLEKQGRIKLIADTYGTHIKVCNYETYQDLTKYKAYNTVTTPYNTVTTPCINKNGNNGNNDEKKSPLLQIFNHWNKYKGCSVCKREKKIVWHSHKLRPDETITPDIKRAVTAAMNDGYAAEDICGAIDNYAEVLLGVNYYWSYVWGLPEFLTRGEEKHKQAARKWWRFLPDNFIEERFLTESVQARKEGPQRIVEFEGDGPSVEFLQAQLDELLKIPEQNRTAKDRGEIERLQGICEPAKGTV